MIKAKMEELMNQQVNAEFASSHLYLSMAAWFESESFPGMASWMKLQASEEHGHAMKFFEHLVARGGKVKLSAVDAPAQSWAGPEATFEAAAAHEAKISSLIHGLMDQAQAEKDHASAAFLQWFVTEQVEEESTVQNIVTQLKMVAGSKGSLLMIDHKLAKRAAEGSGRH